MKSTRKIQISATILSLAIAGVVFAQQPTNFPDEQVHKASCTDFNWNADMAREHPRVVKACQEVVVVNGVNWARLAANFTRVDNDGTVNFNIHDQHNRYVEAVTIEPRAGQVAYINDRPTAFDHLHTTDSINLYVPEGQYGYATRPGVSEDEVAMAAPTPATPPPPADADTQTALADNSAPPEMLPQTASDIPLLALGGLLSLFGGLVLTLRRLGS
ncbi:MAG: hypothetical protein WBV39_02695 [Rudaea sp.]